MTGTLVKFGQRIARALSGLDPIGWFPYLLQWVSLVAGAVAGARTYAQLGRAALWPGVAAALLMAGLPRATR